LGTFDLYMTAKNARRIVLSMEQTTAWSKNLEDDVGIACAIALERNQERTRFFTCRMLITSSYQCVPLIMCILNTVICIHRRHLTLPFAVHRQTYTRSKSHRDVCQLLDVPSLYRPEVFRTHRRNTEFARVARDDLLGRCRQSHSD
jgi:hypothetical protein